MEVNFGIEYLCKFAVISTLGGSASGGKSPVGLHNKASFVKFGSSETLFSNLTKSPFTSVVIILVCRTIGSALADPLEAEDPPPAENNLNIYISAAF